MVTYDIKSHMPATNESGKLLASYIRESISKKHKVIKIVHGYGSTGVGGSIRTATRKSLRKRVKNNEIKAYIPGEAITQLMGFDEEIRLYSNLIKSDSDFRKGNEGITYVIL